MLSACAATTRRAATDHNPRAPGPIQRRRRARPPRQTRPAAVPRRRRCSVAVETMPVRVNRISPSAAGSGGCAVRPRSARLPKFPRRKPAGPREPRANRAIRRGHPELTATAGKQGSGPLLGYQAVTPGEDERTPRTPAPADGEPAPGTGRTTNSSVPPRQVLRAQRGQPVGLRRALHQTQLGQPPRLRLHPRDRTPRLGRQLRGTHPRTIPHRLQQPPRPRPARRIHIPTGQPPIDQHPLVPFHTPTLARHPARPGHPARRSPSRPAVPAPRTKGSGSGPPTR